MRLRYRRSCNIFIFLQNVPTIRQPNTAMQPTCSVWAILAAGSGVKAFPFKRILLGYSHAADGYPLGRMWLMDSFCVGAIRQSARLLGALGRDLGQMPTSFALQSAYTFLNRSFLYRPALIRGVQSGATQHRVATDATGGAFKIGPILRESLCHLSCLSSPGARLNAIRWAACGLWRVFVWV